MRMFVVALAGLALAGCAPVIKESAAADIAPLRASMVEAINPPTLAIWDLQVEAMDDVGNFDPALMDEARWASADRSARELAAAARALAAADGWIVAAPGSPYAQNAEGIDVALIQSYIDANPAAFGAYAQALARHADGLVAAAEARDTAALTEAVNGLQPVCKACHDSFWYPELNR